MEVNIIVFEESEPEARQDAHDQSHCSSIQFVVVFFFSQNVGGGEMSAAVCHNGLLSFLLFQVLAVVSPPVS